MKLEDLKKSIADAVRDEVEKAVTPLKEQVTGWGHALAGADAEAPSRDYPEAPKGLLTARVVRALAASKGDPERAAHFAKRAWDDRLGKAVQDVFEKAMAAGDLASGGFMIPPDFSNEIIDLLRPRSVLRAAGVDTVPMPRGTLTLPKQTGDVSASYVGENQDITKSEPTGGQIVLSAKKLAALVPISNDLLRYDVGDQADRFVRNSIVRRIAIREDAAFLRDDGTQNTPKGLRYWADAANVLTSNGTAATTIEADLVAMINALESKDVDMSRPVWIMSPRSKNSLVNLRDPNGNLIFPEIRQANPTLFTFPVFTTSNVPTNLGAGGDEAEVYLVNVPDCIIGEAGGLEITADPAAAYIEGANLVSAFSRDQTVVRAIVRHDFAVLYPEAVAVLTGVKW